MELLTEILVAEIPTQGAWMALRKDKSVFVEGKDGWWSKELAKEVDQIFVMGIKLPQCDLFDFHREALAKSGDKTGAPIALTFTGYIGKDISLIFRFKKGLPQQSKNPSNPMEGRG